MESIESEDSVSAESTEVPYPLFVCNQFDWVDDGRDFGDLIYG